ncbi:uncharacterized protein LOC108107650 [Drosophila eugracilis]|uniref:uncharacterized protein LOC108107650 n=1 Tax=Drosophila eugracilis TaxID=29029 RepID=UPI0007E7621D|nr:uncharacterized protein LOC108107650 [Drosophila eugracilis]
MSELNVNKEIEVPTVREVHQMLAELLSHGEDITWDLLSANQGAILRTKVDEFKGKTCSKSYMHIFDMFTSIWSQRKFTNGQSLTSLFFVMIVDDFSDPNIVEQSRSWYLYPVFRCRRCVEDNSGQNNTSLDCCMVYVSQYDSIEGWDKFVENTRLHPGLMVTPNRGVYKLVNGQVELKTYFVKGGVHGECHSISPEMLSQYATGVQTNMYDRILYQLLNPRGAYEMSDATELSDSLALFTHSVNNFRLASSMIKEQSYHSILSKRLKLVFDKISGETRRIKGKVDLIRSANEVPTEIDLNELFKTRIHRKKLMINEIYSEVPVDLLQIKKIQVEGEEVNLENYGTALIENILCSESFEDLIKNMVEHFEPEMFKLILQLTQTFLEKTREELWQLLKYHFSTETVLYQIILCVMKHHPNMDYNEVNKQSSDILSRVRYYFASASPNTFPELLIKCSKCVGYYYIK